jgi:hypothetical protein
MATFVPGPVNEVHYKPQPSIISRGAVLQALADTLRRMVTSRAATSRRMKHYGTCTPCASLGTSGGFIPAQQDTTANCHDTFPPGHIQRNCCDPNVRCCDELRCLPPPVYVISDPVMSSSGMRSVAHVVRQTTSCILARNIQDFMA